MHTPPTFFNMFQRNQNGNLIPINHHVSMHVYPIDIIDGGDFMLQVDLM